MSMSDLIGQTLGQYRIEVPLDVGGMGQVFRGVHIYLNRPAAIKVMRPQLAAQPKFQERFLQEARSAAALQHENIVGIYEFGEERGQFYLVMELMTDGSLRSLLHRRTTGGSWTLALGIDLVRQAAEGLAAAHAQSVIHRDIKPDNLLLNRLTGGDARTELYRLKISDFGLARLAQGSGLTGTAGGVMGTPAYMSPEQCQGKSLDGRSDLYSLGVVLYEVATGYQPFQIENVNDAIYKHCMVDPTPPRQVQPDLPQIVEDIILRCLAKKPEDRFQNSAALARALQGTVGNIDIATMAPITLPPGGSHTLPGRTQPQQAVGNMLPPSMVSLPGSSSQPRIRVLDKHGQTLKVVDITTNGITVGRQDGLDLVLQGSEVSRQHLHIRWDGTQMLVKDLGSSNGTLLQGGKLQPQVSQPWLAKQMIRIGPYWLRLEGTGVPPDLTVQQSLPSNRTSLDVSTPSYYQKNQPTPIVSLAGENGRIGIHISPKTLTITPGQVQMVSVTITNLGNLVDWFALKIEGVTPEWVRGPEEEIQLNPGQQNTVEITINVPRHPTNRAQDYPVIIRAQSRQNPSEFGVARARWTVTPFIENSLRVEPRRVQGKGRANYTLTLVNGGNTPIQHRMSAEDDERAIFYTFSQDVINLEPGQQARVGLTVDMKRRWFGKEQRHPFQIHSQPSNNTPPLREGAEFVNKTVVPTWVPPAAGLCVALATSLAVADAVLGLPPLGHPAATPTAISRDNVSPTIPIGSSATSGNGQSAATATAIAQNNATATVKQNNSNGTATAAAGQGNANATAIAQNNATATAIAQNNATATAAVQATATAYQTLYTTSTSGSPTINDSMAANNTGHPWGEYGTCQFTENAYHGISSASYIFYYCLAGNTNFGNFAYQADIKILKGDAGCLLFRYNTGGGDATAYAFCISTDGSYQFRLKTPNNGFGLLQSGSSPAILPGVGTTNQVCVIAQGATFTMYVNGQFVMTATDSSDSGGNIGITALDITNPTDAAFTNVKVWLL